MSDHQPMRVLQCVNIMNRAGLETMLMNYYRTIDRDLIQFDFLVHRDEEGAFDEEIESLGGNIYHMPRLYPQNYAKYFKCMDDFFVNHSYGVVHAHIDSMSFFPLSAAKRAGIKNRIAHSHNSSIDFDYKYPIKQVARVGVRRVANWYFACGNEAGEYLFGKDLWETKRAKLIRNAVDTDEFSYDSRARRSIREEFCVEDGTLVVGHVGRFEKVKNHSFLIRVFKKMEEKHKNSKLLLVGDGPLRGEIEKEVKELNLEEKVIFAGIRSDVSDLMSGMDAFLLPSLFEGVPVTVVEACCSGLPVLLSNSLPKDVTQLQGVETMSLEEPVDAWAEKAISLAGLSHRDRHSRRFINESGYGIKGNCRELQSFYLKMGASCC